MEWLMEWSLSEYSSYIAFLDGELGRLVRPPPGLWCKLILTDRVTDGAVRARGRREHPSHDDRPGIDEGWQDDPEH
jgi:hypothetical protein